MRLSYLQLNEDSDRAARFYYGLLVLHNEDPLFVLLYNRAIYVRLATGQKQTGKFAF